MRIRPSWIAAAAIHACLAAQRPAGEAVNGVTISTHRAGFEWADRELMDSTLADIADLGAGWVAFHPYAGIRRDGTVRPYRERGADGPPAHWSAPIELAHAHKLKVLIKPHIAYWGSGFGWRGEIAFDSPEAWQRFWRTYGDWIDELAAVCKDADGFVIGTELDRTLGFEKQWRALIARVRVRTKAPLTYAANWTHYREVPFWDALDVIGIQAYFPIAARADATDAELAAGWARQMHELHAFADAAHRNVVFTELGYNRSHRAAVEPWEYRTDGRDAIPVQTACMRAALAAIAAEDCVLGAFLWKWFPGRRPAGRNFQLATPEMRAVIRQRWHR